MALRKITRGQSYSLTVSYDEDGVPQSIVGDTLFLTTKSDLYDNDATDATALIKKTVVVPNSEDAQAGNYTFELEYDDTYQEPGRYYTDVFILRAATGKRYPLTLEKWEIKGTPTNREA